MPLFPYQIEGADWLASGEPFLFDEMGLGKSAQVATACAQLGAQSVGIIGPAISRPVWKREFETWNGDVVPEVISFAQARQEGRWEGRRFDAVVIDEGHNLGNVGSQQTRAVFGHCFAKDGLVGRAGQVMCLTGTPMRGHPGQLWPMFHTLKPEAFGDSYWDWTRQYCVYGERRIGKRVVRDIIGGKNLSQLRDRLKPHYMRRLAKDVLELPELRVDTIPLPEGRLTAELSDADLGLIARAIIEGDQEFQDTRELTRLRRAVGMVKAEPVLELVRDTDQPTVLFCYHHDVIDHLCKGLGAPRIVGGMTDAARQSVIDGFQSGLYDRIVCQIQAVSTAVTLTRALWAILVEPLWSAADNWQAIRRIIRIGSDRPVRASFACLEGTVDEGLMRVLARKTLQANETFGE